METPNTASLAGRLDVARDVRRGDVGRVFRTFNANAEPFREAGERLA